MLVISVINFQQKRIDLYFEHVIDRLVTKAVPMLVMLVSQSKAHKNSLDTDDITSKVLFIEIALCQRVDTDSLAFLFLSKHYLYLIGPPGYISNLLYTNLHVFD